MEEISTSFCFICLLHLANEQGLKLESSVVEDVYDGDGYADMGEAGEGAAGAGAEGEDGAVYKQSVGNIWSVNVSVSALFGFGFEVIDVCGCRFIETLMRHLLLEGLYLSLFVYPVFLWWMTI